VTPGTRRLDSAGADGRGVRRRLSDAPRNDDVRHRRRRRGVRRAAPCWRGAPGSRSSSCISPTAISRARIFLSPLVNKREDGYGGSLEKPHEVHRGDRDGGAPRLALGVPAVRADFGDGLQRRGGGLCRTRSRLARRAQGYRRRSDRLFQRRGRAGRAPSRSAPATKFPSPRRSAREAGRRHRRRRHDHRAGAGRGTSSLSGKADARPARAPISCAIPTGLCTPRKRFGAEIEWPKQYGPGQDLS